MTIQEMGGTAKLRSYPARHPKPVVRMNVKLAQDADGKWLVFINGSRTGLPACDVEVELWRRLLESKKD